MIFTVQRQTGRQPLSIIDQDAESLEQICIYYLTETWWTYIIFNNLHTVMHERFVPQSVTDRNWIAAAYEAEM